MNLKDIMKYGQECCMSNKAERVSASRPHTECFITHIAHTVLAFSSVKHKTMLYDNGISAV